MRAQLPHRLVPLSLACTTLLASLFCSCSGARSTTPGGRPHVVLVTIDTLRADHCSTYGYPRSTTPFLDSLAAAGVRFDWAYAPMPVTGPAHAALFTSLSPAALGLPRNGIALSAERPTLAQVLHDAGYRTAAFVGSYPVSHRFGFATGFDHFDDDFEGGDPTFSFKRWEGLDVEGTFDRRAGHTVDRILEWLNGHDPATPLFLWCHMFDPHRPFDAPPPFETAFQPPAEATPVEIDNALYDGEILYADTQLERLVSATDRLLGRDGTLVIVTSDHGEGLMDHGWPTHGAQLYEEAVRVPLVMRWPEGIATARQVRSPVQLIDLFPTLIELLQVDAGEMLLQGSSLAKLLADDKDAATEPLIHTQRREFRSRLETRPIASTSTDKVTLEIVGEMYAVRHGRWKLIDAPDEGRRELYDLEGDPQERNNIVADHSDVADRLAAAIKQWHARQLELAPADPQQPSQEDLRRLELLGYVP